jgi:hypothetical protein
VSAQWSDNNRPASIDYRTDLSRYTFRVEPIKKTILFDKDHNPVQVVIAYDDWLRIEPLLRNEPNVAVFRQLLGRISRGRSG